MTWVAKTVPRFALHTVNPHFKHVRLNFNSAHAYYGSFTIVPRRSLFVHPAMYSAG